MAIAHLGERMVQEPDRSDIPAVHKALRFALENREFYDPKKDLKKINDLVKVCDAPFAKQTTGIRGYRSDIDGSWQPYSIVVPEGLDLSKPVPLWIWLHGRGDKETDLHFLHKRIGPNGNFQPKDAIVLHPFGRQCIGWKHAGERDVFEALAALGKEIKIDPDRIALCGFSMGGAGAWHIGAHYTDQFAAVHAGAGFAETARYTKLKKEDYPPIWEQKLWGVYDVPNYARNLLNTSVIAYSGENDKQIQAARVMEEALAEHDHTLKHVIGPEMGHKYDDGSKAEIEGFVRAALERGRDRAPMEVHLQTRTLRYPGVHWVTATRLEEHWREARVDAKRNEAGNRIEITTQNVTALTVHRPWKMNEKAMRFVVDGQSFPLTNRPPFPLEKSEDGKWGLMPIRTVYPHIDKAPGLQGPIDDAFTTPFLVAIPEVPPTSDLHTRWIDYETVHFFKRWKELFRGDMRSKPESQLTAEDHANYNIIAWGTPQSSPLVRSVATAAPKHDPANQIVAMIRPNPKNPKKYLVINSGPHLPRSSRPDQLPTEPEARRLGHHRPAHRPQQRSLRKGHQIRLLRRALAVAGGAKPLNETTAPPPVAHSRPVRSRHLSTRQSCNRSPPV